MSRFDAVFESMVSPTVDHESAVTVTIDRGGIETTEPFLARRKTYKPLVVGAEAGFPTSIIRRTFMLPRSGVNFGSGVVEPRAGDRINEGDYIWEIYPPEDSVPAVDLPINDYEWIAHAKRIQ